MDSRPVDDRFGFERFGSRRAQSEAKEVAPGVDLQATGKVASGRDRKAREVPGDLCCKFVFTARKSLDGSLQAI